MSQIQLDALKAAGLEELLLVHGTDLYEARIKSWWSATARLKPTCIFQPKTPEDVSKAISTLSQLEAGRFAIRSGGHSAWAGGNNVQDGITFDLGHLNQVTYDADSKTASIGPGQKWATVYETLEAQGVLVAGGRICDVGVGGLVTGGGISFYSGRSGFACDTVVNFQVVLADGRIVDANASSNPDLWMALKGGSGNFGIVTRIDMEAFSAGKLWGGTQFCDRSLAPEGIKNLITFTETFNEHPEAALLFSAAYNPLVKVGETFIGQVIIDTDGVPDSPHLKVARELPNMMNDFQLRTMSNMADSLAFPSGLSNTWLTSTFKPDARIVQKSIDLHETLVSEIASIMPATDFATHNLWQPIPRRYSDLSVQKGRNVLGMDAVQGDALLWLLLVMTKSSEFADEVYRKAAAVRESLNEFAASLDALLPWEYLNYADGRQDPLKSYGEENVAFLREVSRKYDPTGFFQNKFPGGFTLARAGWNT